MDRARECLDEIVNLYQTGPNENGRDLLVRVADLFFVTANQQTVQDREAFGEVMERMAYASDPITRALLAERLSTSESAPVTLIRRLAQDEIFIARPILQYSPCLREGDLVSISGKLEQDHLRATAHRTNLTKPVTDIIVKRGDQSVLLAIVSNTGADFSPESLAHISKAAELNGELQHVLSLRRDLAPRAITKLKRLTEGDFWQQMAETILMTNETPNKGTSTKPKAPIVVTKRESPAPKAEEEKESKPKKIEPIKDVNVADETRLVEHARLCQVEESIEYFTSITKLDKAMVEHCLSQAHISALMVLCKAHGFAAGTFSALLHLREYITNVPTEDTVGMMRRYEGMTADTAKRIISFSDRPPIEDRVDRAEDAN